jgi:hypothetical protein
MGYEEDSVGIRGFYPRLRFQKCQATAPTAYKSSAIAVNSRKVFVSKSLIKTFCVAVFISAPSRHSCLDPQGVRPLSIQNITNRFDSVLP